jgi:hypothetical protein
MMAGISGLKEDLSLRLCVASALRFTTQAPRQLVLSFFPRFFVILFSDLLKTLWAWPFTLFWVVLLVVSILDASSHAIFAFLSHPRRLVS